MAAHSPWSAFHRANTLTYVSLLAGIGAVASATAGNSAATASLLSLAVVADTFDGAFARQFQRTADERAFGAQLDSLSDAVAFGAAPAVAMAILFPGGHWTLEALCWLAVFTYAACAITRLAFYNITSDGTCRFIGLPTPVAALLWASMLPLDAAPLLSVLVLLLAAGAMVAPVAIPRPTGFALAGFTCWPLLVIAAYFL